MPHDVDAELPVPLPSADGLPDQVQVGMVARAHGYDGRLRVQPETDNPERFRAKASLWLAGVRYTVVSATSTGDGALLVKLAGVDTREEAAALLGEPIFVPAGDVPAPPADTYYHYQLLDMAVVDEAGASLGTVTEILHTGANDVYVVADGESELLLPALADVVRDVDVEARRMSVALPDGIERRRLSGPKPARPARRRRRGPARPSTQ